MVAGGSISELKPRLLITQALSAVCKVGFSWFEKREKYGSEDPPLQGLRTGE
jgi:hypothetical protein